MVWYDVDMEFVAREKAILKHAEYYVKEVLGDDKTGHDYWHAMRVYKMALRLAEAEDADRFVVGLAALLHDADDVKVSGGEKTMLAWDFMHEEGLGDVRD